MLSDMWNAEKRGRAVGIYSLAPLLGPAIGPIAGGFIAEKSTWRWVFWATTIADAVVQLGGLYYLQESESANHDIEMTLRRLILLFIYSVRTRSTRSQSSEDSKANGC